jgi:pyruvate,water dikinase
MTEWLRSLKRLFGRSEPDPADDRAVEEKKAQFRERYQDFRRLLAANNQALDLMADMELARGQGEPYDLPWVAARCTALGVNVFQMVTRLHRLAPDKYPGLDERFAVVQTELNEILSVRPAAPEAPLVVPLSRVDDESAAVAGGKMSRLGEIHNRLGLPTPPGFVITTTAGRHFLEANDLIPEINRIIQSRADESRDQPFWVASQIQQAIVKAEVPDDLARAVEAAYDDLAAKCGPGLTVALRSSAVGEDDPEASFAGLYHSRLGVVRDDLLLALKEVLAGQYNPQAMHYRLMRGLRDEDLPLAVGCLAMVPATAGGVIYTANPLDGSDDDVRIVSAWGLPKVVVDGSAETDLFVVRRGEPLRVVERRVAAKPTRFVCRPDEGVCQDEVNAALADEPSLTEGTAIELARLALSLEARYKKPQDVEWALDETGRIVILQGRALRRLTPAAEAPVQVDPARPALVRGGVTVSPGAAAGPVQRVRREADALRFPRGAVLVLDSPQPRWAALLGRAVAVLAARGSPAGHLATVAREYGLPAIFGLGRDLDVLIDGQEVTVAADEQAVFEGRSTEAVERARRRIDLMDGSPVQQALDAVLARVSPLTLTDPDADWFAPKNCRTWHDVTRFCHEMAVKEMFAFGQAEHLPERAQKQLFFDVPMDWWLIDLDDGFSEEVRGRRVRLEQIACRPMLAVWEGFIAVPWEGPPVVSGRGLASVLFRATADPALSTPFGSKYEHKNYFMISRTFMNLQSRFGFHFCAVEALASERPTENYIIFSFKGGAADETRQAARLKFIASLVEDFGFRTTIKNDIFTARVDGLDPDKIIDRLKLIGYLLMHTRQLDMVMLESRVVALYRAKMKADLARLVEAG